MERSGKDNEELTGDVGQRIHWVVIAETESGIMAEFAVNGLRSYEIPAKLDNRPGVLGSAGLAMRSIFTGKLDRIRILVPGEFEEDARELVKMFLGDKENIQSDEGGNSI